MSRNVKFSPPCIADIVRQCKKTVHAAASAGATAIPLPWVGIAIDAATLSSMHERVLAQFNLREDQIDALGVKKKTAFLRLLKREGCQLVGRKLTRKFVLKFAANCCRGFSAKHLARYVPFVGTLVAATLSYTAMCTIGYMIIAECVRVRNKSGTVNR